MILIVGASGCLGSAVSRRLLARRLPVRVASRRPASLAGLRACGAEVRLLDLAREDMLTPACEGVTTVFAAAHALLGRGAHRSEVVDRDGHLALIEAARAAGVRRFVYTSVLRASPDHPVDFWRTKSLVEQALKSSGMEFTILRPSAFMDIHAHRLIGRAILTGRRVQLMGPGTKRRNFVAVDDVAGFAIRAITGDELTGRALDIGGPENHSSLEVASVYGELSGRPVRVSRLPTWLLRTLAPVCASLHPGLARLFAMHALADEAFDETFDPTALLAEFPGRLTTLREFVGAQVVRAPTH